MSQSASKSQQVVLGRCAATDQPPTNAIVCNNGTVCRALVIMFSDCACAPSQPLALSKPGCKHLQAQHANILASGLSIMGYATDLCCESLGAESQLPMIEQPKMFAS